MILKWNCKTIFSSDHSPHKDPTCRDIRLSTLCSAHWTFLGIKIKECTNILSLLLLAKSRCGNPNTLSRTFTKFTKKRFIAHFGKVAAVCNMSVETQLITCSGDWCHSWLTRSKNDIKLARGPDGATKSKVTISIMDAKKWNWSDKNRYKLESWWW